ncbi:hypothetical protein R6Z07F_008243 [Ovis aries]
MRLVTVVTVFLTLGVRGVDVEQSPPALSLQEGASYTLQCNFSTSPQSVNWYLQNSGGHLIQLFYIPSGTKQDGRLKATTVPAERRSSLHISSSQTTDSGTYFCAAQHSAPQAPAACTQTCEAPATPCCVNETHTYKHTRISVCITILIYLIKLKYTEFIL